MASTTIDHGVTAHAEYLANRHFGALDGFRCFSVLAVIWHHTSAGFSSFAITRRGFLGVDMFFVVSGFLIVTLLLRERDRNGRISLREFYIRRTLRIFPVYYGLLAALFVMLSYVTPDSSRAALYPAELPYYLTYTSNWIHAAILPIAWSLATEEQFYLVWPPLEKFARRYATRVAMAGILLCQLVNFGVLDHAIASTFGDEYVKLSILDVTFMPILLGVLLAHLLHSPGGFAAVDVLLGRRGAPRGCLLVLGVLLMLPSSDIAGWQRLALQLAMVVLLASCVVHEGHEASRPLSWPAIRRVGAISYGCYLFHLPAMGVVMRVLPELEVGFVFFAITTAGTLVVAELSFRFVETPFLRIKKRFSS
ncbi:MAG: acyltransferase [Nannocystaceae bacterium]